MKALPLKCVGSRLDYCRLVDLVCDASTHVSVVIQDQFRHADAVRTVAGWPSRRVFAWPGTSLGASATATCYRAAISTRTREILTTSCEDLFGWIQPFRPEDLWFVHSEEESLVFHMTSHGREAYLWVPDHPSSWSDAIYELADAFCYGPQDPSCIDYASYRDVALLDWVES